MLKWHWASTWQENHLSTYSATASSTNSFTSLMVPKTLSNRAAKDWTFKLSWSSTVNPLVFPLCKLLFSWTSILGVLVSNLGIWDQVHLSSALKKLPAKPCDFHPQLELVCPNQISVMESSKSSEFPHRFTSHRCSLLSQNLCASAGENYFSYLCPLRSLFKLMENLGSKGLVR